MKVSRAVPEVYLDSDAAPTRAVGPSVDQNFVVTGDLDRFHGGSRELSDCFHRLLQCARVGRGPSLYCDRRGSAPTR